MRSGVRNKNETKIIKDENGKQREANENDENEIEHEDFV